MTSLRGLIYLHITMPDPGLLRLGWRNICGFNEPILRLKVMTQSLLHRGKRQTGTEEKLPVNLLAYSLRFLGEAYILIYQRE